LFQNYFQSLKNIKVLVLVQTNKIRVGLYKAIQAKIKIEFNQNNFWVERKICKTIDA
jgi:hypothetical protein